MTRTMNGMLRPALMMAEGDGGGGGGGGGDGDDKGGGDVPKNVQDYINKTIQGAITGHTKRLEAKIPTAESLQAGFATLLEEKLKAFTPGGGGGGGADDKAGGDKGGAGGDKKPDPAVARLQGEVENLRKQNEKERLLREENDAKVRRSEERTTLAEALRKGGVPDHHVKTLVPYLHSETPRIKRQDDGKIVWPVRRGEGANTYDDDLSVEAGVTEWLKTDEGKAFLPPVESAGSGNRGGRPPKPGDKTTPQQDAAAIATWAFGSGNG